MQRRSVASEGGERYHSQNVHSKARAHTQSHNTGCLLLPHKQHKRTTTTRTRKRNIKKQEGRKHALPERAVREAGQEGTETGAEGVRPSVRPLREAGSPTSGVQREATFASRSSSFVRERRTRGGRVLKGTGAVERLQTKIAATLYPSSIPAQQRAFLCVANLNHHQNKGKRKQNTDIQESGTALLFGRKV